MMVDTNNEKAEYKNMFDCGRKLIKERGFFGLWKGKKMSKLDKKNERKLRNHGEFHESFRVWPLSGFVFFSRRNGSKK